MRQATTLIEVSTARQGLLEVTRPIVEWTTSIGIREGLLTFSAGTPPLHC